MKYSMKYRIPDERYFCHKNSLKYYVNKVVSLLISFRFHSMIYMHGFVHNLPKTALKTRQSLHLPPCLFPHGIPPEDRFRLHTWMGWWRWLINTSVARSILFCRTWSRTWSAWDGHRLLLLLGYLREHYHCAPVFS